MNKLLLFDVDGTLTAPRKEISEKMKLLLKRLREKYTIGYVGGSNLDKQVQQLGRHVLTMFDYCFPENGLMAYKNGKLISETSFIHHLGEDNYKKLVNYILKYLSELDLPIKRGTFVEFRNGMINVSPIGRNCSPSERDMFEEYDNKHHIRKKFIESLKYKFEYLNLNYVIGGQISFDIFPVGWDKRYCLNHLDLSSYSEIHFFGDKTDQGGNDYELYNDDRVFGHSVKSEQETYDILLNTFL